MKQFSQLILLSSLTIVATALAQASQEAAPSTDLGALNSPGPAESADDAVIDVPARPSKKISETGVVSRASRSPAVEPRVYVEQDGALYYYDYPNQTSHAEQKPPKL